jgi:hypothetical protein
MYGAGNGRNEYGAYSHVETIGGHKVYETLGCHNVVVYLRTIVKEDLPVSGQRQLFPLYFDELHASGFFQGFYMNANGWLR